MAMECHKNQSSSDKHWIIRKGDQTEAIAMEYVEDKPTGRKVAGSLAKVRESTPTGAVMLTRSSQDDPSIIESWVFPPPGTQILGP